MVDEEGGRLEPGEFAAEVDREEEVEVAEEGEEDGEAGNREGLIENGERGEGEGGGEDSVAADPDVERSCACVALSASNDEGH